MNFAKNIVFMFLLAASVKSYAMQDEDSCWQQVMNRWHKMFEDPSLARRYEGKLQLDVELSQAVHQKTPTKFLSQAMARKVWMLIEFQRLCKDKPFAIAQALLNKKVADKVYLQDKTYQMCVWDKTLTGEDVLFPYEDEMKQAFSSEYVNKKDESKYEQPACDIPPFICFVYDTIKKDQ